MTATVYGAQDSDKALTPTAVMTGAYTAAPSDFVPVDASAGNVTVTLPVTPLDRTRIGAVLVRTASGHTATVAGGAGATFNDDGSTSLILASVPQGVIVQYDAGAAVWYWTATVGAAASGVQIGGDLGGTTSSPEVVGTHLASPLPIAQGGTGQDTQQAALDAIAGAVTSAEVLAGNGTHVTLRALAAADLPDATTGAKGAVQLAGDLGGTASSPTVAKIQGTAISSPPGGSTQFLRGDGTWTVPSAGPVLRVPYRAASSVKTQFQPGHGWTTSGTGVGSSDLNDTSVFIRGTQCASVTTAGNGSQAGLSLTGATAVDLTGKMIRLTFQVDDITHLNTINFYVGTSSFGSNFLWNVFTSTPSSLNYVQSGEWITVCISWADVYGAATYTISAAGAPSTKTGFTDMRLAVYDDGAGAVTIHYQSIEIVPDTSATFPNGLVSFTFDDSYQSVYDLARPVMDPYGYTGTLYTIQDQIGQSGRLTLAELRSLQNFSGWEVAGHAYTSAAHNAGYETLTAAQVDTEMRNLKAWLVSNGLQADTFAYPSGDFSSTTDSVPIDQIAAQYFSAARTIVSELNEVWPPPMPWRMKALTGLSSATERVIDVSDLIATGGILERCAQQGAWLQIALHQILTSGVTVDTQLLQSDLSSLLAAISGYGMAVLPAGSVIANYR